MSTSASDGPYKDHLDKQEVMMFAGMALLGIMAGKQLSGRTVDVKTTACEATDLGVAMWKEIRLRLDNA